jgi:hypothetical protein
MSNTPTDADVQEDMDDANDLFADEEDDAFMDEDEVLPQSIVPQHEALQDSDSQQVPHSATIQHTLPDRIITPSPFAQHNTGTSRFRTAFSRILADPVNDTEAWLAVITETATCYASIVDKAAPESYAKLDWVESCYGALIFRFPYAVAHISGIAEILLQQMVAISAAPKYPIHVAPMAHRIKQCEAKLSHIFQKYLGVGQAENVETTTKPLVLCSWVVELWLIYVKKVQHDMTVSGADPRVARDAVTAAYDLATAAAGDAHNNHLLWSAYREFVQSWPLQTADGANVDHALASKQMQQLRSVYQRVIVQPMLGLDTYWQEYEAFEKQQSEALAAALIQELAPKYQHARTIYLERNRVMAEDAQIGRLATPPVAPNYGSSSETEYHGKLLDEYHLLRLWKTRCSYERTNPGRLGTSDLNRRIRHTFCEMACTLTRHPETWHMWSTWELLHQGSTPAAEATAVGGAFDNWPASASRAVQVLQLGQELIPDATLLAYAEAQIVEMHKPAACPAVMDKLLERSPNTLGFILFQKLVHRYQGKEKAREVFARARRTLSKPETSKVAKVDVATDKTEADAELVDNQALDNGKRWMVTNRLDETVGALVASSSTTKENGDAKSKVVPAGPITWHLFAAHAAMEHRLNRSPDVAARVYELGLRKHASFLTVPPYIQRYAQLLLELNDIVNLRALLTRGVAACEAEEKRDALASLWDMTLYFESMGGSDAGSVAALQAIEQKRREALMGPDIEDVATGGAAGAGDSPDSAAVEVFAGSKSLTARERLGGATGVGGVAGPAGGTAIMLAIQQSADWLRPLLLLLPASQLRLPIVAKPPPHMTEMAISALRQYALPAERPADDVATKGKKRLISLGNDGSSDEEDGAGTSGYGAAFRSRQRARMEQNGTTHLN